MNVKQIHNTFLMEHYNYGVDLQFGTNMFNCYLSQELHLDCPQ